MKYSDTKWKVMWLYNFTSDQSNVRVWHSSPWIHAVICCGRSRTSFIFFCDKSAHSSCNWPSRSCRLAMGLSWCLSWSYMFEWLGKDQGTRVHRHTLCVDECCPVEKLYHRLRRHRIGPLSHLYTPHARQLHDTTTGLRLTLNAIHINHR